MKLIHLKYCILALSLTAMMGLMGCSSSADDVEKASDEAATIVENSKLYITIDQTASDSRAISDGDLITGTAAENYISGLRIYFCDSNDNIQYVVSTFDAVSNPSSIVVALDHEGIPVGSYHIYIGANLPETAKTNLVKGVNILDYSNVYGTITSINDVTSQNKFTMFGQALNGTNAAIAFVKGETTSANVNLTRVMAKILLTIADDDNDGKATDPNAATDINISDIQFTVLTTNSKYYFTQRVNSSNVIDPNFSMKDYLSSTEFLNTDLTAAVYKTAKAYNESKITGNDDEYVANSIYCLENTTDASVTYSNQALLNENARKVATYVRISLKATPKLIDGKAFASVKLTDNTYYTYLKATDADRYYCASTKAGIAAKFGINEDNAYIISHNTTTPFVYNVFVNGPNFVANQAVSNSNILRNHFYVLRIGKIYTPFYDETMEINTKVMDWTPKGTTTQNVDTSGTTE